MRRRDFLHRLAGGGLSAVILSLSPTLALALPARAETTADGKGIYERLLILVELKGGNDGLNTVVPYADPAYAALRPKIAIRRDEVLQLTEQAGLHPALAPLLPLWQGRELAILQGVGYPAPNLSHFRSIEIWDTASRSDEFLQDGWLARAFAKAPPPAAFAADGVLIGSAEAGPLQGGGARVIALANPDQFLRQSHLVSPGGQARNAALAHILKVEDDIVQAAGSLGRGLAERHAFATEFPQGGFGDTVRSACQILAGGARLAALRLTLSGFDTHQNQPGTQANLLRQLGAGLAALRGALQELNRWNDSLVLTYAEFGRRPKENQSNGTDHGTASAHFALGGRVRGGLFGEPPRLASLDGNGNLTYAVDFRSVYASVLERWWGVPATNVLGGRFAPLDFLHA